MFIFLYAIWIAIVLMNSRMAVVCYGILTVVEPHGPLLSPTDDVNICFCVLIFRSFLLVTEVYDHASDRVAGISSICYVAPRAKLLPMTKALLLKKNLDLLSQFRNCSE